MQYRGRLLKVDAVWSRVVYLFHLVLVDQITDLFIRAVITTHRYVYHILRFRIQHIIIQFSSMVAFECRIVEIVLLRYDMFRIPKYNMNHIILFKSLRLRPPTPEAYGKTADFGTLCIPGSSQRRDPSAALLSSSDRSRLAALNVMLTPCPVP